MGSETLVKFLGAETLLTRQKSPDMIKNDHIA